MNSRKKKKQSHVIATWRRGLVCLGLICALQVQPLTVLAQADIKDPAVQVDPEGSKVQVDPAEDLTGEADDSTPADDAASLEGKGTQGNVPKDSGNDVVTKAVAPDDALTGDDLTDDADTEKTESEALVGQSAGVSLKPDEYPSRFDLRDLGVVTPVKSQDPWGTCWAFAATAASESSILIKMGKTYAETGLDLSERYLAWYSAQQVTENISSSQAGEGLHLYDENPNNIFLYGGKGRS